MKIALPYLSRERGKTGEWFYRFQRYGKKTRIQGVPGSPEWIAHYNRLCHGEPDPPPIKLGTSLNNTKANSLGRLIARYLTYYAEQVATGRRSEQTLTLKTQLLTGLADQLGTTPARAVRRSDLVRFRDQMSATPAKADNVIRATRAMYNWASDMEFVVENPAIRISKVQGKTDGWEPWTPNDIKQFVQFHPPGTQAYLALLLLYFTAARRSDVVRLGWQHVREIEGIDYLVFRPEKTGTAEIQIEIAPQLMDALKTQTANQTLFLESGYGRPYTVNGFGNRFRKWVAAAGLSGRSPHGIRKAVGDILANGGATNYEIMAMHGHVNPSTSEVYTRRANRRGLARTAVRTLENGFEKASQK